MIYVLIATAIGVAVLLLVCVVQAIQLAGAHAAMRADKMLRVESTSLAVRCLREGNEEGREQIAGQLQQEVERLQEELGIKADEEVPA